jgi:hypothetical protein
VVQRWMIRGSSPAGAGNFFLHHHCVQTGSGAHPTSYLMATILSLVVKRPEREADHPPPSSAEVNNGWGYISTPPIHFHGVVLI